MSPTQAEWLARRRQGLGASEVAAVLGLSPFASAWDVWVRKTDPEAPASGDDSARARGRRLESAVLDWMSEDARMDRRCIPPHTVFQGPESWALCTPDDLYHRPQHPDEWGMEAKTDRDADGWGPAGDPRGVPVYYALQAHWCMYCTGAERWDVGVYLPIVDDWRRYTLERDPKVEQVLVERCGEWWERHVVQGLVPDMTASPAATAWLSRRFRAGRAPLRAATPAEEALVRQHVAAKLRVAGAEIERDKIANQLRQSIGDAEGLIFRGGKATWKADKRGKRTLLTSTKEPR
jgi:putative phage-type endonuclease